MHQHFEPSKDIVCGAQFGFSIVVPLPECPIWQSTGESNLSWIYSTTLTHLCFSIACATLDVFFTKCPAFKILIRVLSVCRARQVSRIYAQIFNVDLNVPVSHPHRVHDSRCGRPRHSTSLPITSVAHEYFNQPATGGWQIHDPYTPTVCSSPRPSGKQAIVHRVVSDASGTRYRHPNIPI
jgi:hypothetical protein